MRIMGKRKRSSDSINTSGLIPSKSPDSIDGDPMVLFPSFRIHSKHMRLIETYCEENKLSKGFVMRQILDFFVDNSEMFK